jgi:hypothetical protein
VNKLTMLALLFAGLLSGGIAAAQTTYIDGQSPGLTGVFDLGTHRPSFIAGATTTGTGTEGTQLDGVAVSFVDINSKTPNIRVTATSDPFNLLVWDFGATGYDSVRLYNLPDAGYSTPELWAEYMQFSVWGCNSSQSVDCKDRSEWTLLSDVTGFGLVNGLPVYDFATGTTSAATIYRGGSAENGPANAYTQDYTYGTPYNFYGVRASTLAMQYDIKAPELDAMAAFNRRNFDAPIPEPATLALMGLGLGAIAFLRRRY